MKNQAFSGILYGEKVAGRSLVALIVLAISKAAAGLMTGAVVLLTDAIATGADVVTLFGSYIGLKLSKKGAEGGFKYGYYKIETLIALVISLSIIYLGVEVLIKNIKNFNTIPNVQYPFLAVGMVVLTIAFSLHYARELSIAAEKANSLSLLNNAKEKESDILTSVIVLAAIIASFYRLPYVESIIGIGISGLILKVGLESAKDSLFYLLDYWDDPKLIKKIEKIIRQYGKIVTGIKKIRLRRAGTWIFGEVYLEIPPFADSKDIRSELNQLQKRIQKANSHIKDFIVYFKIPNPETIQVAIPVKDQNGKDSRVAMTGEETKYYMIVDIKNKEIQNIHHLPVDLKNPANITEVIKTLEAEGVDVVVNNNLNSLLYYSLQHIHHMQLYPAFPNIESAEDTVKLLLIDS